MERHYDRIKVVEYLDKLSKIENCILLDSNLEICRNYIAEDFNGDVLVCFRDYTRHFWFRYSFDDNMVLTSLPKLLTVFDNSFPIRFIYLLRT